ncbi:hypothetical protein [Nannocystis radixulma]|uniref:Uncharacterized protein n=1 Tax=Nannocystis radixulma TaxID=2995305 RepID=A0ABT5B6V3_9BACT|nr:hypothetical protein [Nannocystis radixulma]MDC0669827.1 hypothetical protein [Nannocystis radixulma]
MNDVERELRAIIRREEASVIPPEEARERGWARLSATLAAGAPDPEPAPPVVAPRTPWLRIVPSTALLVGALASLGAWLGPREPPQAIMIAAALEPEPQVAPLVLSRPFAPVVTPTAPEEPAPVTPASARPTPPRPATGIDEDAFAAELRLLATAQAALGRGELNAGLAALRTHARRYPGGHFAQDRDALLAIARCEAKQPAGPAAGRRFLTANATSIHADRVRTACGL